MKLIKRLTWVPGLLSLAGCIEAGSNSDVIAGRNSGESFPTVVGINLEGREIELPAGFTGLYNLVAIAFEQDQQALVDTWIAAADGVLERPGLEFYELPTIYQASAVFRFWVNNGMRSGIKDPVARARTITIYVDRAAFLDALAIERMDDIHVLLLDNEGRILWRTSGPSDARKIQSLLEALAAESESRRKANLVMNA